MEYANSNQFVQIKSFCSIVPRKAAKLLSIPPQDLGVEAAVLGLECDKQQYHV
jgi:hypothetical protein